MLKRNKLSKVKLCTPIVTDMCLIEILKGYRKDCSVIPVYINRVHLQPHNIRVKSITVSILSTTNARIAILAQCCKVGVCNNILFHTEDPFAKVVSGYNIALTVQNRNLNTKQSINHSSIHSFHTEEICKDTLCL